MIVTIRPELVERELGAPVGNLYYFDIFPLKARWANEEGEFDDDGNFLQIFLNDKWRKAFTSDWDFHVDN